MALSIVPNAVPVGAELRGIDLSTGPDDAALVKIREALDRYALVFMRGQKITHDQHVAFTRRLDLGPLKPPRPEAQFLVPGYPDITRLSNIVENGVQIGLPEAGQYWHSDRSYEAVPNGYALLYAIEIPHGEDGKPLGSTMFVNTAHAYDTLPEEVKRQIDGLRGTHFMRNPFGPHAKAYKSYEDRLEPVLHPVVRRHPRSGRKCLYVNQQYSMSIEGLDQTESRALIDYLCAHIIRPEYRYVHEWQVGDFLIWDDCSIQHHAIGDYKLPQRRLIQRTSIDGAVPV